VRQITDVPVAVGFGIGSPATAAEVATFADGVIVGSAMVDTVGAPGDATAEGTRFIRSLAEATAQKSLA
jgi:tryptophan synthase alpha chain